MLEVRNLHVSVGDRKILDGLNLTVKDGEVAAIMGPNGTGKSTLSYVIAGREDYEVEQGEVLLDGVNLLDMDVTERANAGVFLAFQYPLEIPGVATMTFLKAALNAHARARGDKELQTPEAIAPRNGDMIRLAPGPAAVIDETPSGRLSGPKRRNRWPAGQAPDREAPRPTWPAVRCTTNQTLRSPGVPRGSTGSDRPCDPVPRRRVPGNCVPESGNVPSDPSTEPGG